MGITSSSYTLLPKSIACNGEVEAIFSLAATPNILTNPTDIVLVLDCSASMLGEPFAAMKAGVNTFLDILDEATDDSQNGQIGSGSRAGIVHCAFCAKCFRSFFFTNFCGRFEINRCRFDHIWWYQSRSRIYTCIANAGMLWKQSKSDCHVYRW